MSDELDALKTELRAANEHIAALKQERQDVIQVITAEWRTSLAAATHRVEILMALVEQISTDRDVAAALVLEKAAKVCEQHLGEPPTNYSGVGIKQATQICDDEARVIASEVRQLSAADITAEARRTVEDAELLNWCIVTGMFPSIVKPYSTSSPVMWMCLSADGRLFTATDARSAINAARAADNLAARADAAVKPQAG